METSLLSREAVAKYLNCSTTWLDHAGKKGPRYYRFGRIVRYCPSDLRDWLDARKV